MGTDAVFEQYGARRRSTDFRCGTRLGTRGHLIVLHKPARKPDWMSQTDYDLAPESLVVRELQAGGKTLVTTLLCEKETSKAGLRARDAAANSAIHIPVTSSMRCAPKRRTDSAPMAPTALINNPQAGGTGTAVTE